MRITFIFRGKYVRYVRAELVRVGIPTSSCSWSRCSSGSDLDLESESAARVLSHLRKSGNKLAKISERTAAIFMRLRAATCCTASLSAAVCRCLRPVEYFSNDPALIAGPGKHIYLLLHAISYPLANQFAAAFPSISMLPLAACHLRHR